MCIMIFSEELQDVFIQTVLNNKCIWAGSKSCLQCAC